jgi:YD repeat-containing protein
MDGKFPCLLASVTNSVAEPQLSQCDLPIQHSGPTDQFEVDLRYGNFILRQSDLQISDVFDVPLTRTYNSSGDLHSNPVHSFGRNASHPYDISPVGSRYPYTYQMLVLEDGNFIYFPRVSEGTSYADAVYQHTETATDFYKAVTHWNGNGWTTWRADGSAIVFPEAYNAKNAAQGAAIGMRDAAGNKLQLIRDDERNLQEIRTPHKRSIKFQYDDQSRIIRAEDDRGGWTEYHYDDYGMLTDAISSSGHARHYSYNFDLMTQIEDETHHVLLRNWYDNKALVRQDFGNGQIYSFTYTPSGSGSYAEAVDVTFPSGVTTRVETGSAVPDAVKHPPQ